MMKVNLIILLSTLLMFSCVENITETQSTRPTIRIISPTSGDTVQVGSNKIYYEASDYPGGEGLEQFEVIIESQSGRFVEVFEATGGSNTDIYLNVDSTLLGTKIDYFVNVRNIAGKYGTSEVQKNLPVVETLEAPPAPTNLVLTKISTGSVNLFWDDNSKTEDNYELWRRVGTNDEYNLYRTLPKNTISFNDIGLSELLTYYYKVRAVNRYGNSAFSNEVSTTGGEAFNLQAQALGASQIMLTWESKEVNILGFRIQRTNPSTGNFEQVAVVAPTSREYTDKSLLASTTYSYRIASFNSTSQSAWSNIATATTAAADVPAPTNLIAQFDNQLRMIVVRWTDNTNQEVGTFVERREGNTGDFVQVGNTTADVNVFMDSNIVVGTTYYYRARHLTTQGFYTPYSNIDDVFVPELPPAKPTTLQIFNVHGSANQFSLVWNDNSDDEDGFTVFSKVGSSGNYSSYATYGPKEGKGVYGITVTVPDPVNNEYFFKVRAFKGNLNSDFSNEVSTRGHTGTLVLSIPAASITRNSAVLQWNDIFENEFVYFIERKRNSFPSENEFSVVGTIGGAVGTGATIFYTDTNLDANTQYTFRVRALLNTQQYSNYSNEVTITTPFN